MEVAIVLGALLVIFLIVGWLLKIVRTTLRTALFVAFVLIALWVVFGIGPGVLWEQIQQWIPGGDPPALNR